jgi:hypothetical protein
MDSSDLQVMAEAARARAKATQQQVQELCQVLPEVTRSCEGNSIICI